MVSPAWSNGTKSKLPAVMKSRARQGQIPHLKLGRSRRYVLTDVLRWLEEQKAGGGGRRRKTAA